MIKNKKIYAILLCVLLFMLGCSMLDEALGKFTSKLSSKVIGEIAFYIIDLDYQNIEINLDEISPSDKEYIYEFSVANFNEEKRLETNAEYNIVVRTTTNLNLEYKLYENGIEQDTFIERKLEADSDGTYYNIFKTKKEKFGFTKNQKNNYELIIKFPKEYIGFKYQDIIESVEIIILSSQITE